MRDLLPASVNHLFYVLDTFILAISMYFSWVVKDLSDPNFIVATYHYYVLIFLGLLPLYILIYASIDLYSSKRGQPFLLECGKIIQANLLGFIIILGLLFGFKLFFVSRFVIIQFAVINTILTILTRFVVRGTLRFFRSKGYNVRHVLVVGAGTIGQDFVKRLARHKEYGYNIIGFLDDDPAKLGRVFAGSSVLGEISQLEEFLQQKEPVIDELVVALPTSARKKLAAMVELCEREGTRMMVVPDYYRLMPTKPRIIELDHMPLILLRSTPLDVFANRVVKRAFDIFCSLILIILFTPVMLAVTIGIKVTSPGVVFFRQRRVGLNRKEFDIYKFRSMRVSTDKVANNTWTVANDPRRTKFGEFIRATSLDELPQFFNVLKGDMSLIGPRPERPYFVDKFKEEVPKYMVKHQVKPGITGWAQVNGWRGDTSIEERIKCDIYYIENWSVFLDVKILVMTVLKGFVNRNAY